MVTDIDPPEAYHRARIYRRRCRCRMHEIAVALHPSGGGRRYRLGRALASVGHRHHQAIARQLRIYNSCDLCRGKCSFKLVRRYQYHILNLYFVLQI